MLPPISFALFGLLAPRLVPKYGLEKPIFLALGMIFLGIVGRSLSINVWMYGLLSFVCLGGIGMCNALLPPIIKQHFPNRLGLVTSIYTSLIYVSAGLPSLLAVPLTQAVGWRISTGSYAILALIAVVPWLFMEKSAQTPLANQEKNESASCTLAGGMGDHAHFQHRGVQFLCDAGLASRNINKIVRHLPGQFWTDDVPVLFHWLFSDCVRPYRSAKNQTTNSRHSFLLT